MKNRRTAIFISLAFAALVYLALSAWSSVGNLKDAFSRLDWQVVPFIFLLTLANYTIRFSNWQFYLNSLGFRTINRLDSLLIYLSGFSMTITPGKVGEVIRSYWLKEVYHIPVPRTASIVLVDRLTDLIALVLIAGLGALHFQYGAGVLLVTTMLALGIIVILTWKTLADILFQLMEKVGFLQKRLGSIRHLYESSAVLLQPRRLLIIVIISVLAWSCEAFGFYLTFKALGIEGSAFTAFFIYAFSTIIGALSLLPGGLGLVEGSIAGLLHLVNVSKAQAAAATLIIRLATLWFGVLVGAIALLIAERKFKSPNPIESASETI